MAVMLEGMLRSCNNLVEHMHHSHTMYLLAGIGAIVPLAVYIFPLVALLLIPPLVVRCSLLPMTAANTCSLTRHDDVDRAYELDPHSSTCRLRL